MIKISHKKLTFVRLRTSAGQSLIELLLASALLAIFLPILIVGLVTSRQGRAQEEQRISATTLLHEAKEVVRSLRQQSWNNLSNGTFHPSISGSTWTLQSGTQTINNFSRSITITDAQRSSAGVLVSSGGTTDPSTKRVEYVVSWNNPSINSVQVIEYIHRYLGNTEWFTTTKADFDLGTKTSVITAETQGGEVQLAAGGGGNWCAPDLTIATLDLPKNGTANAISAIEGRVFAGTGENASGVSYANVTIANSDPPTSQVTGTFDSYKTNAIFGETNYAYLATDNNAKEIVIVDLTQQDPLTQKYSEIGSFDAPGSGNGGAVTTVGNIGYAVVNSTLYTFDLSSKTGSRPQLASVNLAGTGTEVVVSGAYAYVSTTNTSNQLQIIQVGNNGTSLSVVGNAALSGQAGQDIVVNSTATRAYVVTSASASQREFFIVDISTKTGSRPTMGSYEANGMSPKDLTIVTGNKAVLVGSNGEEYQVVDISNENTIIRCGGLNIDTGVNGVASVLEADGDAYSYIITGDATSELKIIEGGPGGEYATSGTYESPTLTFSSPVGFNSFIATVDQPVSTEVRIQVAVNPVVDGSCTNAIFSFVGPDGDSSSFFSVNGSSISGTIPFGSYASGYQNPQRCFRYKAYFSTTDQFLSPVLQDVRINYSP